MVENKLSTEHNQEKFTWDASAKQGVVGIICITALFTVGILNKKSGGAISDTGVPESIPTFTSKTLSIEEKSALRQKNNEKILAIFQEKVKDSPNYIPTRAERIALAELGIAVNDGAPIPFEGDGNEDKK